MASACIDRELDHRSVLRVVLRLDRCHTGDRVRLIPFWQPIPDTIGRSCADTNTVYDATQVGRMYDTYNLSLPHRADNATATLHGRRRRCQYSELTMTTSLSVQRVDNDDVAVSTAS